VILHINHVARTKPSKPGGRGQKSLSDLTSLLTGSLVKLIEDRALDARLLSSLHVHLDWLQYKTNFRDRIVVRRAVDAVGQPIPLAEIAIDLRQADETTLPQDLADALHIASADSGVHDGDGRITLDQFSPFRESIIWRFNRLFWERVGEWEAASGKGFEAALPGGKSDANDERAVADTVRDFWGRLRDLDQHGQLPSEIFALEIGVGAGTHAKLWLDQFKQLDDENGTGYYERLCFIFGDYSQFTLERARAATGSHARLVKLVQMDALDPVKALSAYHFKVSYVHLTNVYDNLIFDELVRRDGRVYIVEVRAYVGAAAAAELHAEFGVAPADLPDLTERLLEVGPDVLPDRERGVAFWRALWGAMRLEERLRALDESEEAHVPPGLTRFHLEDLLAEAPDDVRFHVSRGAAESFANTLPLLHPRGYLEVQDIFVAGMEEYRQGFRGPGKLDGSLVTWVNGALLRAVGRRAGYDVHFKPYTYRPGSRTSILYTTQRA
jgi:hypothetical protein